MPREKRTANCLNCGIEFTPKRNTQGLYCSRSCRGKHMTSVKETHPRWKGGDLTLTCANCGTEFARKRFGSARDHQRVFCSVACKDALNRGPNHKNWQGGRFPDADGYIRVWAPDHPNAFSNGYVYEHILVASRELGRPLEPGELVHHRDLHRANNDPANLEVLSGHSEHRKLHHRLTKEG